MGEGGRRLTLWFGLFRDESHGIAHAKAVRDNVLKIWDLCDEGEVGELEVREM